MSAVFDFSGKTVFVAGGTSGINLGIAEGFAAAGARVAVLSRSHDKVEAALDCLRAYGIEVMGYAADVRDYPAIECALKEVHEEWGDFDVLVSGAAGNFPAPALGISPNGFQAVIDIDLRGSFHVLRAAYPMLRKPGCSVINISAPQAFLPMALQAHVCAAKAGVDMLTRVLALEWGGAGVRVNSISPGPIDGTEGMRRLAPSAEIKAGVVDTVPLGRMGAVTDIANAALFLASPSASYISGVVLPVDGGWALGGASTAFSGLAKSM